jgi:hypothetical protein
MKRYILSALLFLLIGKIYAQSNKFELLKDNYRQGFVTLHSDTIPHQKAFFNAFPSNFNDFNKLYGWNEQTHVGRPLTLVSPDYFSRFFEIKCVSHKALTKKIIDVSVNGVWIAGAVSLFQVTASKYAITYNKEFVAELQTRSKADIISVWAFYLDYENPYARKNAYEKLVKAIQPNGKKMLTLVTAGYKKAGARWKKH